MGERKKEEKRKELHEKPNKHSTDRFVSRFSFDPIQFQISILSAAL